MASSRGNCIEASMKGGVTPAWMSVAAVRGADHPEGNPKVDLEW
eukprot:CAMPEP_0196578696 /NCGR_PEP_ID=MMETSP1081-20130531/7553_1 /TAXON_ID=36882 /ORGANISM="Pyramimonas amylifera, Strain CCMP720" /LENGTH=43 /DNA_ID= /DNA_START= /DNA_END= /DNA_ORIENTATION=